MRLLAYRPEYLIRFNSEKNRLYYQPYELMSMARALPHYLADWQRVLQHVRPGFTILTDTRLMLGPNLLLTETYAAAQRLLVAARVRLVAEVHPAGSATNQTSRAVSQQTALPVHIFTTAHEAEAFLDRLAPPQ